MRKGRSSRRSRGSRPPTGVKVSPSSAEALRTEVGVATTGPRVVVGVPPSDPPPAGSESTPSSVEAKANVDAVASAGSLAVLDRSSEKGAEDEKTREEAEAAQPNETASIEVEGKSTGKRNKKKNKNKGGAKAEHAEGARSEVATDPDQLSVPPIGDLAVDEEFFSEGDVSRLVSDAIEGDALTYADNATRKSEPHVVERRARFARYVKWAVTGAVVVCLAAVARTTMSSKTPTTALRSATVVATETARAVPKAAAQAAAPTADLLAAPEAADPAMEPEPVTGDAKEEKTKSRVFLEKRRIEDAIDAGERSVKLDPTDGEAWLILGAAYQEKGNMVEARRAYSSCVKQAMSGPRHECAKMLR